MPYLAPSKLLIKMVDAVESKLLMSTKETLFNASIGGAMLALTAVIATSITLKSGDLLAGALVFPVSFTMLYLLGFNVFSTLFFAPLSLFDSHQASTVKSVLKNIGIVLIGNLLGLLSVAIMTGISYLLICALTNDLSNLQANLMACLIFTSISVYAKQRLTNKQLQTIRTK